MGRRRLDVELVARGLFDSRARARAAIGAGGVTVAGAVACKPSDLVEAGADIAARPAHPWVSRAGLKLDHALELWPVRVEGRVVLDLGASTGGFTQVCLSRGARRVYAVDVGRDQLHPTLASDPRVTSLEGTDARALTRELVPEPPQLLVCDASFIGLAKVLPAALGLAAPAADLIALVKPQFEVGPALVGKGGIVTDAAAIERAVANVSDFLLRAGWPVRASAESPIRGGDGNREVLLWANRGKPPAAQSTAGGPGRDRLLSS